MNLQPYSRNVLLHKINDLKKHNNNIKSCVDKFSFKNNHVWAWCCKVVDGDTIHACFFINNDFLRFNVRLHGVDTPELRSKDPIEKQKALEAKSYVTSRIFDKPVYIHLGDFDKYGRLLGIIYLDDNMEISLNQQLIDDGHAKAYFGGKK